MNLFAQHLAIAEALLEDIVPLAKRFALRARFGSERAALDLQHRVGTKWEEMWVQLDEARTIVASMGRSTSQFDRARAAAGDRWAGAANVDRSEWYQAGANTRARTIAWRVPEELPARAAIAALRIAMPEVVVPSAPPSNESPVPWWATWVGVLVVGLGLGLFVLFAFLSQFGVFRR